MGEKGEITRRVGHRLGGRMEIMDAEMVGIKKAIEIGIKDARKERRRTITIAVDSQSALNRVKIRAPRAGEMMAHKIRRLYVEGKEQGIKVRLEWVKGHSGVKGNEEADKSARESAAKGRTDRDDFTSIAYLERESRECTIREWEENWLKRRNSEKAILTPRDRHKIRNEAMKDQETRVILSRLRTGRIDTNAYLHRINKRPSGQCECREGEQNVKHVMTECRFTTSEREKGKEHDSILKLLWCKEGLSTAVKIWKGFCKRRKEERGVEEVEANRELERGWGDLDREGGGAEE